MTRWDHTVHHSTFDHEFEGLLVPHPTPVYQCPELYELAYPGYEGDLPFYCARSPSGHVLYLGVGTGRIFVPMAQANPNVRGVEASLPMWHLFRQRFPNLAERVFPCDAARAPVAPSTIDRVVAPYSFLQVVGRERLPRVLTRIRAWLRPGGTLLTDTFSPYSIPFTRPGLETIRWRPRDGISVAIHIRYDHVLQQMRELALVEQAGRPTTTLDMRLDYFFPRELLCAMRSAGFAAIRITGDYGDAPFDPTTHNVLVYEATAP